MRDLKDYQNCALPETIEFIQGKEVYLFSIFLIDMRNVLFICMELML